MMVIYVWSSNFYVSVPHFHRKIGILVFFRFANSLGALSSERADNDCTHLKLKSEPASLEARFLKFVRFLAFWLSFNTLLDHLDTQSEAYTVAAWLTFKSFNTI